MYIVSTGWSGSSRHLGLVCHCCLMMCYGSWLHRGGVWHLPSSPPQKSHHLSHKCCAVHNKQPQLLASHWWAHHSVSANSTTVPLIYHMRVLPQLKLYLIDNWNSSVEMTSVYYREKLSSAREEGDRQDLSTQQEEFLIWIWSSSTWARVIHSDLSWTAMN